MHQTCSARSIRAMTQALAQSEGSIRLMCSTGYYFCVSIQIMPRKVGESITFAKVLSHYFGRTDAQSFVGVSREIQEMVSSIEIISVTALVRSVPMKVRDRF